MVSMNALRPYASLGRRGELGRLRQIARAALRRFGVDAPRLTVLRHEHNTTFRVDDATGRYVLRLNRVGLHNEGTVASEMSWLRAIGAETNLGVPAPVAALDGSLVIAESTPGVPEPRLGVLLRWQEGRLVDRRLTPAHMASVGDLLGQLQQHALQWTPPRGFARPRVDVLTAAARRASVAGPVDEKTRGMHPAPDDAASALALVAQLLGSAAGAVIADSLRLVRQSTEALAGSAHGRGLIHADLHYENVLFREGRALAIDFDDCGWGIHLYDLAVPLSELEGRSNYEALRDALLDGYARQRPLPPGYDDHLRSLAMLRRVQLILWILESRESAAFRDDWRSWARKEVRALARAVEE
jgi:Ser/Thr protein kinase RdoA (MazF antagonist)